MVVATTAQDIATRTPTCPTCGAPGELVELQDISRHIMPNLIGFICSQDSKHWELYKVTPFPSQ